ncbi:hypothetical protein PV682_28755 [Streptomyces niveiscabiei]|uniref:hypothetical protein n=1 Tax=Streptomyces niveiscabiei TaxID=164115 RepID=UPI0029BC3D45|nr:hypothetical protein [Streptomyces niveiscabiei]MDX3385425.1 hypothetical protein [Streptomyces niveiscabiei]
MSGGSVGTEAGVRAARARALAVLRLRGRALGAALLPAAAAVILLAGGGTGHLVGPGWDRARWIVSGVAVVVLIAAAGIALLVARARPALSPTVPIPESAAPDLYRLVRDLADRLDVPAPSAIALTPDCDSWLEDRTHRAHGTPQPPRRDEVADTHRPGRTAVAPVLVIGSPFLWWMRVGELRAVLAPVVAGTGPSAHPDIAAARRFVRGLDAAVAVTAGRSPRVLFAGVGHVVRLLLRGCRVHAAEMERGVAAAAAERAQTVDYGLRIVAQEQVGLAYAGWDRLLTRVALPAWRMGRWPSRLDAGVVAALTELSRRDRLAEGFASRLGERPACDLLEEPGTIDEATSLLAARLFHGGPTEPGPDWSPVSWQDYPDEVVDRKWRTDAARLHRTLDAMGVRRTPGTHAPTLARVLEHLTEGEPGPGSGERGAGGRGIEPVLDAGAQDPDPSQSPRTTAPEPEADPGAPAPRADDTPPYLDDADLYPEDPPALSPRTSALAARLSAELARDEAAAPRPAPGATPGPDAALWDDAALPLFPLQPPRTERELLADHVTAMVCCAAMDTAGATPGLDWLDGPVLLVAGERAPDLTPRVLSLVEDGDPDPLRVWLVELGIRPEKPLRLV